MGWTIVCLIPSTNNLYILKNDQMCSGHTQPPIKWVPGVLSSGVKPGPQVDHSLPSSAEFKEEGGYISVAPVQLHGTDRGNITFCASKRN